MLNYTLNILIVNHENSKSEIKRDRIDYSYDIINIRDIACKKFIKSNKKEIIYR